MKKFLFFCFLYSNALLIKAQDPDLFQKKVFKDGSDSMPYRILLPLQYDVAKNYPLIFFLHGSGERGNNNIAQLTHGANLFLTDSLRERYPAIVVFPQCPANSSWSSMGYRIDSLGHSSIIYSGGKKPTLAMKLAQLLLSEIIRRYPVNLKKIYVGGLSMGGMGTFEMVQRNPGLFAAAFPICGGGDLQAASKMIGVNWWVFHGADDDVVPAELSVKMVQALKKAGANVKFSLYPGVKHNSWDNAFAEPGLLSWLFSNQKK